MYIKFGFFILFRSTRCLTVVLYSNAISDNVSPLFTLYLILSSFILFGFSTFGICVLSFNRIFSVYLSLSTFPLIPDTLPLSVYWNPSQYDHLPLFSGLVTPYCAIHKGYFVTSPSKVLLALYASLYTTAFFPDNLSTSFINANEILLISSLLKFGKYSKSIANFASIFLFATRDTKNVACCLASSSFLAVT